TPVVKAPRALRNWRESMATGEVMGLSSAKKKSRPPACQGSRLGPLCQFENRQFPAVLDIVPAHLDLHADFHGLRIDIDQVGYQTLTRSAVNVNHDRHLIEVRDIRIGRLVADRKAVHGGGARKGRPVELVVLALRAVGARWHVEAAALCAFRRSQPFFLGGVPEVFGRWVGGNPDVVAGNGFSELIGHGQALRRIRPETGMEAGPPVTRANSASFT